MYECSQSVNHFLEADGRTTGSEYRWTGKSRALCPGSAPPSPQWWGSLIANPEEVIHRQGIVASDMEALILIATSEHSASNHPVQRRNSQFTHLRSINVKLIQLHSACIVMSPHIIHEDFTRMDRETKIKCFHFQFYRKILIHEFLLKFCIRSNLQKLILHFD